MKKKLYKPLTVFVHQTASKQLQTPIWQKRCKAGRELIRGLNSEEWQHGHRTKGLSPHVLFSRAWKGDT